MRQVIQFTDFLQLRKHGAVEWHNLAEIEVFVENLFGDLVSFGVVSMRKVLFRFDLAQAEGITLAKQLNDADLLHLVFASFA